MIDFHTHSILSDGALIPSELVRRARVAGYTAMAITDHVDESNMIDRSQGAVAGADQHRQALLCSRRRAYPYTVTHTEDVKGKDRRGSAATGDLSEPVEPGSNMAYIKAKVDVLAHPGLITDEECRLAARNSVHLEITSRGGHNTSNGHVASASRRLGAPMLVNTDCHAPGDLISDERAMKVALGAGLCEEDFRRIQKNAKQLLEKVRWGICPRCPRCASGLRAKG